MGMRLRHCASLLLSGTSQQIGSSQVSPTPNGSGEDQNRMGKQIISKPDLVKGKHKSRRLIGNERNFEVGSSSFGAKDTANTSNKLVKLVDMSEMAKGPEVPPGHWLVTGGGQLGVEKGKIVLRVKYSLLNY